jgi:hypothetical protein
VELGRLALAGFETIKMIENIKEKPRSQHEMTTASQVRKKSTKKTLLSKEKTSSHTSHDMW